MYLKIEVFFADTSACILWLSPGEKMGEALTDLAHNVGESVVTFNVLDCWYD